MIADTSRPHLRSLFFSFGFNMTWRKRRLANMRKGALLRTLLPQARNSSAWRVVTGRTKRARTSRNFDSQKVQHGANRPSHIPAPLFILHVERIDSDPVGKIRPDFCLAAVPLRAVMFRLGRIELRARTLLALLHLSKVLSEVREP